MEKSKLGRRPVLNQEQTEELKRRIVRLQQVGFGLTATELHKTVYQFCSEKNKKSIQCAKTGGRIGLV